MVYDFKSLIDSMYEFRTILPVEILKMRAWLVEKDWLHATQIFFT
jgi:hypothetical protein